MPLDSVSETDGDARLRGEKGNAHALPGELGGYRIVRVLSHSPTATTLLVRAGNETLVARLFARDCPSHLIDAEVAAHDVIARSAAALREHVVAMRDLVTASDRRLALILDLAAGPSLADLLASRHGTLSLGEAVTILAPLTDALDTAHAMGLTGLSFDTTSVRFTEAGAPVVVRVSEAVVSPPLPERFRSREPAYSGDRDRRERLAHAVARAVTASDRPALTSVLSGAHQGVWTSATLFGLAAPEPVILHGETTRDGTPHDDGSEQNSELTVEPRVAEEESHDATPRGATPRWLSAALDTMVAVGVPVALRTAIETAVQSLITRLSTISVAIAPLIAARGVARSRFVVVGALGCAALVTALMILWAPSSPDALTLAGPDASSSAAGDSPSAADDEPLIVPTGVPPTTNVASARAAGAPESLADPGADDWPLLTAELVSRWVRCHAAVMDAETEASAECVAEVAHAGSAAHSLLGREDPRHAVLERWLADRGESVVVERMGGAAVIDLVVPGTSSSTETTTTSTATASLLVVRSEAGWRIRSVLSDEQVD
ncbi:hypothetical protein [Microcella sp.]|uniref:hypothetical protein n=1 Tax=Microcella sp. TaxID=1913979 RepID=UPI00299F709D|nr:hypothetical protein [Microcella sp.]MDX2026329.1 hypothetical protein [Microcella sp.]